MRCCRLRIMSILLWLGVRPRLLCCLTNQQHWIDQFLAWLGVVLDWFTSYLSDHLQCVKIGSILSDAKKLLIGVPQGSALSPILFSLYTTPISKVIRNHPCTVFALLCRRYTVICSSDNIYQRQWLSWLQTHS